MLALWFKKRTPVKVVVDAQALEDPKNKEIEALKERIEELTLDVEILTREKAKAENKKAFSERKAHDALYAEKGAMAGVRGIQDALMAIAGDCLAMGETITPVIHDPTAADRLAMALSRGEKPVTPNLSVPLELKHIAALWTLLSYYTKGMICQQPFPVDLTQQQTLTEQKRRPTLGDL